MYHKILGPEDQNIDIRYVTISVLPKSSYLGMLYFFQVYARLLKNPFAEFTNLFDDFNIYNKQYFNVIHAECPKHDKFMNDQELEKWQTLEYNENIPWNMVLHDSIDEEYTNQHRVVFIYRNPLDQLVSHYRYLKGVEEHKLNVSVDLDDFTDFIFNRNGLDSYIKMFFTFHIMRKIFPQHILFVPYEQLMINKAECMRRIIQHVDIPYDAIALNKAIEFTTKDQFKKMETYGMDEEMKNNFVSNVRDGGVGVWQKYMAPEIVKQIELKLQEFSLSLDMFYLADDLLPKFAFLGAEQNCTTSRDFSYQK